MALHDFVVARSALGHVDEIASTNSARIYLVRDYSVPGEPFDLVYKQYKKTLGHVPLHGLEQIVSVRHKMHPDRRRQLDARATWPLRVVVGSDDRAVGVLMRLIPPEFFQTLQLRSGKAEALPRELQYALQD